MISGLLPLSSSLHKYHYWREVIFHLRKHLYRDSREGDVASRVRSPLILRGCFSDKYPCNHVNGGHVQFVSTLISARFNISWWFPWKRCAVVECIQKMRDVYSMVAQCWATMYNVGTTFSQHWVNFSCLLGIYGPYSISAYDAYSCYQPTKTSGVHII